MSNLYGRMIGFTLHHQDTALGRNLNAHLDLGLIGSVVKLTQQAPGFLGDPLHRLK